MKQSSTALLAVTVAVALSGWACSNDDDAGAKPSSASVLGPSGQVAGAANGPRERVLDPSPSPAPSSSPLPVPVTTPGSCPMGDGVPNATCRRGDMVFFPQVQAAVDQVLASRPDLFDLTRTTTEGGQLVLSPDAFYRELVVKLQGMGICAEFDVVNWAVQVKKDDVASETYRVISDRGFLDRGEASYVTSCTPAAFPLAIHEIISYVRVGFYGIECYDGQTKPGNNDRKLPVDCFGLLTATPKDVNGRDVDARLHGPEITWTVEQVDDYVDFLPDPQGNEFNKVLRGLDPGWVNICATVQGIKGCADFEVVTP